MKPNVIIRPAKHLDLGKIFEVEKSSYPSELQAPLEVFKYRFESFGIWVAEVEGNVVGFFTCVPVRLGWPEPDLKKVMQNRHPDYRPWFEEYAKGAKPDSLFVTSTAVAKAWQGRGIGRKLILHSLKLTKELGLRYRVSVLRLPYLKMYRGLGFELGQILPDYEKDAQSDDFGVLAWKKV